MGVCVFIIMHGRMTMDPRIPAMPGRRTSDFNTTPTPPVNPLPHPTPIYPASKNTHTPGLPLGFPPRTASPRDPSQRTPWRPPAPPVPSPRRPPSCACRPPPVLGSGSSRTRLVGSPGRRLAMVVVGTSSRSILGFPNGGGCCCCYSIL